MLTAIICATDLSHRSDRALERAAQLAEQLDLPLHVVSVIDPELPNTLWQAQKDQVLTEMEAALARVASPARERATIAALVGTPSKEVAVYASALDGSLIVLGCPRASEPGRSPFGSFSAGRILRAAAAPVLIAKAGGNQPYRKAAVGVDLSAFSKRAGLLAAKLVPTGEVTLVHAYRVQLTRQGLLRAEEARRDIQSGHIQRLDEFMRSLAEEPIAKRIGASFSTSAREGEVQDVLRGEVERTGADLLAIGTHGRSRLSRALFGSVAEDMLMEMPCDLLISVPN